jgi:LysR family transcriptional regulator, transcriptional activator of nodD3 and syrA
MDPTRLAGFDLNLLVVLDVLLAERSVTKAAKRLGLSQSAVSNALARLRESLDDVLLVRAANAMVPTSRALALQREVRDALDRIGHAIGGGATFDPKTAHRSFVIAATDYVQFVLLGALVERVRRTAPGVSLQIVSPARDFPWTGLEAGSVDLLLAGNRADPVPRGLHRRWLFRDHLVCMLRAGHRYATGTLTLDRYLELDHIEALPIGAVGLADEILSALGRTRRIVLTVPHFLIAPFVVMQSDCCFTLAHRIAQPLAELLPLRPLPVPFGTHRVAIGALWHDRAHGDPAHRWLRRMVIETNAELAADIDPMNS